MIALIMILLTVILSLILIGITLYGVVISFQSKWYFGVLSLLVPGMATFIGLYKLLTKENVLQNVKQN